MSPRWPITDKHRQAIVETLLNVATGPDAEAADRAIVLLLRADKLKFEIDREQRRAEGAYRDHLLALAAGLPSHVVQKFLDATSTSATDTTTSKEV